MAGPGQTVLWGLVELANNKLPILTVRQMQAVLPVLCVCWRSDSGGLCVCVCVLLWRLIK